MSNSPSFYGQNGLTGSAPRAIISQVIPGGNNNIQADPGTILVYTPTNSVYIQAGNANGLPVWQLVEASGGTGVFTGLTNTGTFNQTGTSNIIGTTSINSSGAANTLIGNAGSITASVGTIQLNAVGAGTTTIGSNATAGDVLVNSSTVITEKAPQININSGFAGATQIGGIVAGLDVDIDSTTQVQMQAPLIGINAAANGDTTIGSTATGGNIVIAAAAGKSISETAPNININNTGTGATTIGSTATGTAVQINSSTTITALASTSLNVNTSGNGATNIGSTGTGGNIAISAASGNSILLRTAATTGSVGAGNISMIPQIVTNAGTAATLNNKFGQVVFTGNTIAGGASTTVTITNGAVNGADPIFVTAYTPTVNAALSAAVQVPAGGGSFNVFITNPTGTSTGAANIYVTFWVLG